MLVIAQLREEERRRGGHGDKRVSEFYFQGRGCVVSGVALTNPVVVWKKYFENYVPAPLAAAFAA
jgi:hypothetical protein